MVIFSCFFSFFNETFEKKLMVTFTACIFEAASNPLSQPSAFNRERGDYLAHPCSKIISKRRIRIFFANLPRCTRNTGNRSGLIQNNQHLVDNRELVGKKPEIFTFPFWPKGECNLPVSLLYSLM